MSCIIPRTPALVCLTVVSAGCGGGGSGGGGTTPSPPPPPAPVVTSVAVTCTPAELQISDTGQCTANVQGTGAFDSTVEWSVEGGGEVDSVGSYTAPTRAATVTVTATSVSHPNVFGAATITVSRPRALVDLPDDDPGYQVHILYVVASDGEDRELDTNGAVERSVAAWNEWLASQTEGRRLRLDRVDGALDVTFVRLDRTDAQINAYAPYVRDHLETELILKGFNAPNKIYHVYYDGGNEQTGTCGGAARPPTLPGTVGAIYLNAIPLVGAPCHSNSLAASVDSPGYLEFASLHEIVHGLGFVPDCAPNLTDYQFAGTNRAASGHVSDSNTDLMYAGPLSWNPSVVDFNGDDYFEADLPDCLDLADSAFLDPLPASAERPPGWPYETLDAISCDQEGSSRSTDSDDATRTSIHVLNGTGAPINVYWLDHSGTRQFRDSVRPYGYFRQLTYDTHPWVVTDETNQCLGVYRVGETLGRAVIEPPGGDQAGDSTQAPSTSDGDGDGIPNVSDPDDDNDGVPDADDPCPLDGTDVCDDTSSVGFLEVSGITPLTSIGDTIELAVTAHMLDGSTQAIASALAHWVTADPAVASVTDGTVTSVGAGNARIVATYQGQKAVVEVSVHISVRETGTVRVIYAVPADREFRSDYPAAIQHAIVDLQSWYRQQLGGLTFSLYDVTPEQCRLSEIASYYDQDPWPKVVEDLQHCAPVQGGTTSFVWVVYPDLDPVCDARNSLGRGGPGLTILHHNSLEGLIGNRMFHDTPCGRGPFVSPLGRYTGGLGHELGHALGLSHPPGCDEGLPSCDSDSLMNQGFRRYPDTYLRPEDKQALWRSPFIRQDPARRQLFHDAGNTVAIRGTVTDPNGLVVEGTHIAALADDFWGWGESASDGSYEIRLPAGLSGVSYLSVHAGSVATCGWLGYHVAGGLTTIREHATSIEVGAAGPPDIEISLPVIAGESCRGQRTISGTLRGPDGGPEPVWAGAFGRWSWTGRDGLFEIRLPESIQGLARPSQLFIQSRECGLVAYYGPGGFTTRLSEAWQVEFGGVDVTGIEITLPATAQELCGRQILISGSVVGPGGDVLEGIRIQAQPFGRSGRSGADGLFEVRLLEGTSGTSVLRVHADCGLVGYYGPNGFTTREDQATGIEVGEGSVTGIEIRLPADVDELCGG